MIIAHKNPQQMKTFNKILLSTIVFICLKINVYSQCDITGFTGHIGSSTYYLGWDGSTNMPLDIRTDNSTYPQPINFYTSDHWPRMQIYDSLGMPNAGNVAIGYFSLLTNGPQSLLHMDQQDTSANYLQMTNATTSNGTDNVGFQLDWQKTML
jgi:hypothetical protein